MDTSTDIVAETARRIFADLGEPGALNRASNDDWRGSLWQALEEAGLTLAWVPEDFGGAGAGLADGFAVLRIAGEFAAPLPLAETLIAGHLLGAARLAAPAGAMTVAPLRPADRLRLGRGGRLTGRARGIPFARDAAHIAVVADSDEGEVVALVPASALRIEEGRNLARDPSDTVSFDGAEPLAMAPLAGARDMLMLTGAVARSVMSAGALGAVLDMSVAYANERVAFERPIAKFQAVQHSLARLAGEAAAAATAAGSAAEALAQDAPAAGALIDDALFLEAAAAKIRCAEAATEGAAIAHQVFGALGFTREHVLHRFTLRLLSWREDFGNESHWATALGQCIAARGADDFWPLIASR